MQSLSSPLTHLWPLDFHYVTGYSKRVYYASDIHIKILSTLNINGMYYSSANIRKYDNFEYLFESSNRPIMMNDLLFTLGKEI